MLWIANTQAVMFRKRMVCGYSMWQESGALVCVPGSAQAPRSSFFSRSGVQAGTHSARGWAEPGMPLSSCCQQQPPTPGSPPLHYSASPHLVSKVLDDKSLIWHTWFFEEGTFIQMSIVQFLGPSVIRAFWHLRKRTHSHLKYLKNFAVAKETKKMGDNTLWFAFKLPTPWISSTEATNQLCTCLSNTPDWK